MRWPLSLPPRPCAGLAHAYPFALPTPLPTLAALPAPPLHHCRALRPCSGRKRAKGEMNGKSCNINNAAHQIYPDRGPQHPIPLEEVLCVFDADQVGGVGWGGVVARWSVPTRVPF